jgi:hypothetical protein
MFARINLRRCCGAGPKLIEAYRRRSSYLCPGRDVCQLLHAVRLMQALSALDIDDRFSILDLPDDAVVCILRAARQHRKLVALATACKRLCALARSRIPARLWVTNETIASRLVRLQQGAVSRLPFVHCDRLILKGEDAPSIYQLPAVLTTAAAQWVSLSGLHLTVLPPEALPAVEDDTAAAAAAAAAAVEDGGDEQQTEEQDEEAVRAAVLEQCDSSLAGLIMPLAGLKQLQRLSLTIVILGPVTAIQLGNCQALTSLHLEDPVRSKPAVFTLPPDLTPLSKMSRLVELDVQWTSGPTPPAAADGPFALPTSLRQLSIGVGAAYWLQHLPGCPLLEQLKVGYYGPQHASAHPAAVLEAAAQHTPGLRHLRCDEHDGPFNQDLPLLPAVAGAEQQQLTREAVSALTALEVLEVCEQLVVHSAAGWEALGSLRALTQLQLIVLQAPPPRSWQHTRLQQLYADLEGVTGDGAAQVLLACPSLQKAHLRFMGLPAEPPDAAGAAQGVQGQQGVQQTLSILSTLHLDYSRSFGVPAAVHAAPMLAAASHVAELALAIRDLDAGDVVAIVQPLAPTLRVLEFSHMPHITPQAAIALQDVLPHLEQVCFHCCGTLSQDGSSVGHYQQLARLRQQLRTGLTLKV